MYVCVYVCIHLASPPLFFEFMSVTGGNLQGMSQVYHCVHNWSIVFIHDDTLR